MSYNPSFVSGDFKAVCMRCGCVFKGSQLRKTWDGLYVCKADWEEKHPQLQVRGVRDDQRAPFTVPDITAGQGPEDFEVPVTKVNANSVTVTAYSADLLVGPTASRPSSPSDGLRYFDTTLSNMIFANGSNWYYADGSSV